MFTTTCLQELLIHTHVKTRMYCIRTWVLIFWIKGDINSLWAWMSTGKKTKCSSRIDSFKTFDKYHTVVLHLKVVEVRKFCSRCLNADPPFYVSATTSHIVTVLVWEGLITWIGSACKQGCSYVVLESDLVLCLPGMLGFENGGVFWFRKVCSTNGLIINDDNTRWGMIWWLLE